MSHSLRVAAQVTEYVVRGETLGRTTEGVHDAGSGRRWRAPGFRWGHELLSDRGQRQVHGRRRWHAARLVAAAKFTPRTRRPAVRPGRGADHARARRSRRFRRA